LLRVVLYLKINGIGHIKGVQIVKKVRKLNKTLSPLKGHTGGAEIE
jgi:hypothetical protein